MKRFHVHVAVDDLKQSIGFYSALFAAEPSVTKTDYAKWMLDDPRVNFAISTRGRQPGLDHLGIQAESGDELKEIYAQLHKAGGDIVEQGQAACCYAKSKKSWIDDPAGISWEAFHTTGESTDYGDGSGERVARVAHTPKGPAPYGAKPRQKHSDAQRIWGNLQTSASQTCIGGYCIDLLIASSLTC
jgi:predicted lactoylglutathione lyase